MIAAITRKKMNRRFLSSNFLCTLAEEYLELKLARLSWENMESDMIVYS
jgi:hypothetical protein